MRRTSVRTQALGRADRTDVEPRLRELLDHLGRLLAKEYVRRMSEERAEKSAPHSEKRR